LHGKTVLDIGSGNGYYGWRMLGSGAKRVMGIDPTPLFVLQWLAAYHCAGDVSNWVLPLGIEQLPGESRSFDAVFSMGVLYHRKNPIDHLRHLRRLLRPGGELVLETLVLNDPGLEQLIPDGRYARMRNVWSVPSLPLLEQWLEAAGLPGAQLLDVSTTTTAEQRSTAWMQFESLEQCLDPRHPERTIEGHPSPTRAALMIRLD
jgi:tRNA (mo5U34)-methyltransferase